MHKPLLFGVSSSAHRRVQLPMFGRETGPGGEIATYSLCRWILAISILFAAVIAVIAPAHAKTGTYRVALLHVTFSDTNPAYTLAQLQRAAGEIRQFYEQLSYGRLDLEVQPVEVKLTNTGEFYLNQCQTPPQETRNPCPPPLIEDAAQAAAASGFSFANIDGIGVLSTFNFVYNSSLADFTDPPITIARPGVSGTFQRSYLHEGSQTAFPSGVWWGSWAHEIGHQLEFADNGTFGPSSGHPSGYNSGYDLMDSCYPCGGSSYTLLGAPIVNTNGKVFAGWLSPGNVAVVNAPSPGTTVVLTPLEQAFTSGQATQAIQIPIAQGVYYMVDVRRRLLADTYQNFGQPNQGIYDEGVHIVEVEETRSPPMKVMNACDTTVTGGCVNNSGDPRAANCSTAPAPWCWPYDLWHVGDTFTDSANAIQIRVDSAIANGFAVTVKRGAQPGHPNMFIVPWLTPPMNTYETVDIWVDSSCNGYESDVGAGGLRYGRRSDGTVIGNGDDPCANHENRIYAHVRNIGDAPASKIVVHFRVSSPLGVGVTGTWSEVGEATIPSLAAGAATDVFVTWTPVVNLTPQEIAHGHFRFHSCIQAIIDPVQGEIVTSDNMAQENFDDFEAVQGPQQAYAPLHGNFFLFESDRDGVRTFNIDVKSALPKSWKYKVANSQHTLTLGPNETVQVPVDIQIPKGTPVGQSYSLLAKATTLTTLHNEAIPPNSLVGATHLALTEVGGVNLAAHTVLPDKLSLTVALDSSGEINASGTLSPTISTVVAVDFIDERNNIYTRLAHTDSHGKFACKFATWRSDSKLNVRAIWQGNQKYASAVSPERLIIVRRGTTTDPDPTKVKSCP